MAAQAQLSNATPPLAIDTALATLDVALRQITDDDLPFLQEVYNAYRWAEVERFGWPLEARLSFLADQFRLQHTHYIANYPGAALSVVTVAGEKAGRLYLYRVAGDTRIVDIAFLPQWCNRGIGGALIAAVQEQARLRGDKVSIHVERENPARRLYQRLGFAPVKPAGIYDLLEWTFS